MEEKNLFDKIEKLEETSELILHDSIIESNQIKDQLKKEFETFTQSLKMEKESYWEKLELEFSEEEKKLKRKYESDYKEYENKITSKFQTNLKQVIQIFVDKYL